MARSFLIVNLMVTKGSRSLHWEKNQRTSNTAMYFQICKASSIYATSREKEASKQINIVQVRKKKK